LAVHTNLGIHIKSRDDIARVIIPEGNDGQAENVHLLLLTTPETDEQALGIYMGLGSRGIPVVLGCTAGSRLSVKVCDARMFGPYFA
jgi:hypothetical protein